MIEIIDDRSTRIISLVEHLIHARDSLSLAANGSRKPAEVVVENLLIELTDELGFEPSLKNLNWFKVTNLFEHLNHELEMAEIGQQSDTKIEDLVLEIEDSLRTQRREVGLAQVQAEMN